MYTHCDVPFMSTCIMYMYVLRLHMNKRINVNETSSYLSVRLDHKKLDCLIKNYAVASAGSAVVSGCDGSSFSSSCYRAG